MQIDTEATSNAYRDRIYGQYVYARHKPLAPASLSGLKPREPYFKRMIRDHFPARRDAKILEIGCGHGALIHVLSKLGYTEILGFDSSPEQVQQARALGIQNVVQGDLHAALASQEPESLDCVVAFDVVEHMHKAELLGLVDVVRKVLRPGGTWIIHTVNGESPFSSRIRYGDFTHELAFTRISMAQVLLSSGFSSVHCYEDKPVPHGIKSLARAVFWEVVRMSLQAYLTIETGAWDTQAILSQNFIAIGRK